MTKQDIISKLTTISDCHRDNGETTIFELSIDSDKLFSIYCGDVSIYCNCVRIDNGTLIDFIYNGKIVSICRYSLVHEIDIL